MTLVIREKIITKDYKIRIPKDIKVGDKVLMIYEERSLKIIPKKTSIKSLKGIIKECKIKSYEIDKVLSELKF